MHVKRAYVLLVPIPVNVQDGGEGSLLAAKIRLLWQAAKILLKSLECRFLVRHGSNTSFETVAPL